MRTEKLSDLIESANEDVKQAKELLYKALYERNSLDYLQLRDNAIFELLSDDPSITIRNK